MKRSVAACVPRVHVPSVEEQVFQVLNHPVSTNLYKFYEVDGDDDEVDDNGNDVHVCSINAEPFRFNRPFFP